MNHPKQHTLWLLSAMAAPIAHFSGGGWVTGTIAAFALLLLTLLPRNWEFSKPVAVAQLLWLGIVTGLLLPGSAAYWPSDNTTVVPLTILFLAALTDRRAAPRIGAVLAMCMALLSIPVWISAASRIELSWLVPAARPWPWSLSLALLLPALPASGETGKGRRGVCVLILTVVIMTLVQGTIGPSAAASLPDPAYQTARSLGHMEPVAASALTLGWYALSSMLLQSAFVTAERSGISRKWASVLVLGTSTILVLFPQQPDARFVSVISLFLWVITPFVRKISDFEKR